MKNNEGGSEVDPPSPGFIDSCRLFLIRRKQIELIVPMYLHLEGSFKKPGAVEQQRTVRLFAFAHAFVA